MIVSSAQNRVLKNLVVVRDLLIVVDGWTLYMGLGRVRKRGG
jgi:hypothetical protein